MSNAFKTEQEAFWAGEFGNDYIDRNKDAVLLASNTNFFSNILNNTQDINSIIEFGANIGMNLMAIKSLLPNAELSGVEINTTAAEQMKKIKNTKVYTDSILEFTPDYQRDLALIKGVLIHINPDHLNTVYDLLYNVSKKYICIAEYYNPVPVKLSYRGNEDRLFKRDFAGEMLDRFDDLKLVDYGFAYHRDNNFPLDDINWFLLEK